MVACVAIGVVVTLLTKPPSNYDKIKGLTLWTIKDGPKYFKGSEVNKNAGITIKFSGSEIEVSNKEDNTVSLPKKYMNEIKGERVTAFWMMTAMFIIWIIQLSWSSPWMIKFRFGPVEWLWRTATYLKVQPFRN